jgi:predicted transcriptional regulator of viral defense system
VCIKLRIFVLFAHMKDMPKEMPDHDALYRIAEQQAGYFTAAQARQAGFSSSLLSYHLGASRFERVRPHIYRFVRFPASPHEDLHIASLQAGPKAVISHDSALALYDLSDLLPDRVHVTIPRTASRRRPGLRLHTNQLEPEDVARYEGLPVTTVLRTLVDVATAGLPDEQVRQAIHETLRRGLISRESLFQRATSHGGRIKRLVEATLYGEEQR